MLIIEVIGQRDHPVVEALVAGLVAADQQNGRAARIEGVEHPQRLPAALHAAAGSMDKCMGVGFSQSCCSKAQAKGLFAGDDTSSVAQRWDFLGKCKAGEGDKPKKK